MSYAFPLPIPVLEPPGRGLKPNPSPILAKAIAVARLGRMCSTVGGPKGHRPAPALRGAGASRPPGGHWPVVVVRRDAWPRCHDDGRGKAVPFLIRPKTCGIWTLSLRAPREGDFAAALAQRLVAQVESAFEADGAVIHIITGGAA